METWQLQKYTDAAEIANYVGTGDITKLIITREAVRSKNIIDVFKSSDYLENSTIVRNMPKQARGFYIKNKGDEDITVTINSFSFTIEAGYFGDIPFENDFFTTVTVESYLEHNIEAYAYE
jgi:hypothetical protein